MAETNIEWADKVWNPTRGCSRVSPGCDHCYAMYQARRHDYPGGHYEGLTRKGKSGIDWAGQARFVPEALTLPLRWKKPSRIFVDSMSDLFHHSITNEQIAAVFGVMAAAHWHDFLILTKRAERLPEWFRWIAMRTAPLTCAIEAQLVVDQLPEQQRQRRHFIVGDGWPPPNVWLGVSVESSAYVNRVERLLEVPAAVHWISIEPLLGPMLGELVFTAGFSRMSPPKIDWVVLGGESGSKARPYDVAAARAVIEACRALGAAVFHKQLGRQPQLDGSLIRLRSRKGGDVAEWPAVLQDLAVRQFPRPHPEERRGVRAA